MSQIVINPSAIRVFVRSILAPALQIQSVLSFAFFATFLVSVLYYFNQQNYPQEVPWLPLVFAFGSLLLSMIGALIQKIDPPLPNISLRRGAWIVLFVWIFAVLITALYFVSMGLPVPGSADFSFARRLIDGIYEALSGFTTTGASILPSVEVFPRSFLFMRSVTHWIGGMGIAYLGVTVWRSFKSSRETIINSESESPDVVSFATNDEARQSGLDFIKAYSLLSFIMFALMLFSGWQFREVPYPNFLDNIFDSLTHTFSVLGTGGFSTYDTSAGLPLAQEGSNIVIGGLRNVVSEWIMAFFMAFAGMNFSLWYILFFGKSRKKFWRNTELRVYLSILAVATLTISYFLRKVDFYPTLEATLRYAFFNVTTIISTTGLGNWDFIRWPSEALAVLFLCFLIGGMVGSTAGGPKVARFVIAYKFLKQQIINFVYGSEDDTFKVDGSEYDTRKAGLVVSNVAIYYLLFLAGGVLLLIFSPLGLKADGGLAQLDFGTAMAASIANLGNIGPAISISPGFNIGPTGNYYAFTEAGKIIMIILMYIGRVGVLTCLMLGMRTRGETRFIRSVPTIKFDPENPALHQ